MNTLHPSSRLLILACSATKRDGPQWMPAIERYDGPLWKTLRRADPRGKKAKVAFVSARYGFRDAATDIETYDTRMTAEMAERMKGGGVGMRWPQPLTQRRVMPSGEHAGMHIASLVRVGEEPLADIALVGGRLYLDVMRAFVEGFQRMGTVARDARIVEINGPIGIMRKSMAAWLDKAEEGGRP